MQINSKYIYDNLSCKFHFFKFFVCLFLNRPCVTWNWHTRVTLTKLISGLEDFMRQLPEVLESCSEPLSMISLSGSVMAIGSGMKTQEMGKFLP